MIYFICPYCNEKIEKEQFKTHVEVRHRGEEYYEYYMTTSLDVIESHLTEVFRVVA